MWPRGSSGWPQSGHGRRPAATTSSARFTNARATSTVSRTCSVSGPSSSSSSIPSNAARSSPAGEPAMPSTADLELVEQDAEPFGENRNLDLLEDDRDDLAGSFRLEEERPVAGLADGAGHEAIGWVEMEESSRHGLNVPSTASGHPE